MINRDSFFADEKEREWWGKLAVACQDELEALYSGELDIPDKPYRGNFWSWIGSKSHTLWKKKVMGKQW